MAWDAVRRIDSQDSNVFKYVFTQADAVAEVVLYRYGSFDQRTVICCSTMSGCPVGCRFCGAGDFFARTLTAQEILDQVHYVLDDHGIALAAVKRAQVMFMSMGEPMLNRRAMAAAILRLYDTWPNVALLVSTSAPRVDYEWITSLAVDVPTVGLQFSVHESTDEARNLLIPFSAKLSLAEISETGTRWAQRTGRQAFFNYCVHEGNNSIEDADRLRVLFDPTYWQATVSVICERDESVAAANARQRELATDFEFRLMDRGFQTRTFDPAGQDDIGGGCGQLWFVQQWAKEHDARPSVGRGLPVVHTPRPTTA